MELAYSESKRSTTDKSINLNNELVMKELININPNKEDNCEISNLKTEWKTILSNYMSSRCITCNTYGHNSYFVAIDDVNDVNGDTTKMLNKAKVTIYSIDYIVDSILIRFKDEKYRELLFKVIKVEVA